MQESEQACLVLLLAAVTSGRFTVAILLFWTHCLSLKAIVCLSGCCSDLGKDAASDSRSVMTEINKVVDNGESIFLTWMRSREQRFGALLKSTMLTLDQNFQGDNFWCFSNSSTHSVALHGNWSGCRHRANLSLIVPPAKLLIIIMVLFLMTSNFGQSFSVFPMSMKTDSAKRTEQDVWEQV